MTYFYACRNRPCLYFGLIDTIRIIFYHFSVFISFEGGLDVKNVFLSLLLAGGLVAAVATGAESRTLWEIREVVENPRIIENAQSKRMHVTFPHQVHKSLVCRTCHHNMTEDRQVYVSCTICHAKTDIADRSGQSYFLAVHRLDSDHSCAGCHAKMAEKNPKLKGCQSCHSL